MSSPLRYNLYRANVVAHAVSTGTLFITIEIEIFNSTSYFQLQLATNSSNALDFTISAKSHCLHITDE